MKIVFILAIAFTLLEGAPLQITSSGFMADKDMPSKYTCDGDNVNPPLTIKNFPATTQSFAIIMDDPDAPNGTFVHWVTWNIPADGEIKENSSPGKEGLNGKGTYGYTGPCPPSGKHHYHFKVYALDTKLDMPEKTGKAELEAAMKGHVLATGEIVGLYSRMKK
jgi:Raf kinase inhibitor-like YbhB/YbcL family protein